MGMMDVLKRWMGGEKKQAPTRPAPQMRAPVAKPAAPRPAPAAVPPPPQPTPMTAAEAMDVLAAKAQAKTAAPVSVERREKPRVNAREGTTVLVIDDSPTIVALLKRMLEQSGYHAIEAGDAESGVAMALSEEPDLIFLDIVLPGMNGFEALRRLRRDPITKTTPIIMISGNELATEQFYAQRIGADDFMKKPFSRSEVFARIEKLLDEHKVIRKHVVPSSAGAGAASTTPSATATTTPAIATAAAVTPAVAPVAPAVAAAPVPAPAAAPISAPPAPRTPTPVVAVVNVVPPKPATAPAQRPTTH